jgi:hypothetical protein
MDKKDKEMDKKGLHREVPFYPFSMSVSVHGGVPILRRVLG